MQQSVVDNGAAMIHHPHPAMLSPQDERGDGLFKRLKSVGAAAGLIRVHTMIVNVDKVQPARLAVPDASCSGGCQPLAKDSMSLSPHDNGSDNECHASLSQRPHLHRERTAATAAAPSPRVTRPSIAVTRSEWKSERKLRRHLSQSVGFFGFGAGARTLTRSLIASAELMSRGFTDYNETRRGGSDSSMVLFTAIFATSASHRQRLRGLLFSGRPPGPAATACTR